MEKSFWNRIANCIKSAIRPALKTSAWLLKIMLPVTFFVTLLSYYNILPYLASFAAPLFTFVGLPGDAALVFVTSIFTNLYTVLALLSSIEFTMREAIIISTMCLISHGFLLETIVLKKTGSSASGMITLRLVMSFVAAFFLNLILPDVMGKVLVESAVKINLIETLKNWFITSFILSIKIIAIITGLMIFQRILEEFGILKIISGALSPLMKIFGLDPSMAFMWIVGNTVGLAYGSAIMIEYAEKGKMSGKDADLLNHHLAISHSQLEDPLLFAVLGLPLGWLIFPRMILAIVAVWIRRAVYAFRSIQVIKTKQI